MPRDRKREEQSLRRRQETREVRKTILIVTEGEKTEPDYFNGLRKRWRLSTAEIEVVGKGATPSRVVEEAVSRKEKREQDCGKDLNDQYDEVWAVVDWDEHTDLDRALQAAKQAHVNVALSAPCFEFWYLLHFAYTTRDFPNLAELKPVLKKHLPDYDKTRDYLDVLMPKLDYAFEKAAQLRKWNEDNATERPCMGVDLLVKVLEEIAHS